MAAARGNESPDECPCSIEELQDILTAPSGGLTLLPSDAYDEVFPSLYLGEESIAKDRVGLKKLGITHILNAAVGQSNFHVDTNEKMFQRVSIQFMGIEATDHMSFQLQHYFSAAIDFIHKGIQSGGKVMVNCKVGASRSATLVLAYLMVKHNMTVQEAMRLVRSRREICPNDGFLQQLCDLNEKLKKSKHFSKEKDIQ